MCVWRGHSDDPHRRQQESELQDTSFDHADVTAETEMTNKKHKDEVLVNHNDGRTKRHHGAHGSSRLRQIRDVDIRRVQSQMSK